MDYISSHEAANRLQYTVQHTRRLIREGKLNGEKFGRDWMVVRESVERYTVHRENLTLPLSVKKK